MQELPEILKKTEGHLVEGVKPIRVCLGSYEDLGSQLGEDFSSEASRAALNIDFDSDIEEHERQDSLHGGRFTYVISSLNNLNKKSFRYYDCTGIIVVGTEKGKRTEDPDGNISFLSHQNPSSIVTERIVTDLKEKLREVKEKCIPGTIDAVIIGGKTSNRKGITYKSLIKPLGEMIKRVLGFEPTVVNGPKRTNKKFSKPFFNNFTNFFSNIDDSSGKNVTLIDNNYLGDSVYFDNKNRRLYLMRPKVNNKVGDFRPSEIESVDFEGGI